MNHHQSAEVCKYQNAFEQNQVRAPVLEKPCLIVYILGRNMLLKFGWCWSLDDNDLHVQEIFLKNEKYHTFWWQL